jgi:hypothetical protein
MRAFPTASANITTAVTAVHNDAAGAGLQVVAGDKDKCGQHRKVGRQQRECGAD